MASGGCFYQERRLMTTTLLLFNLKHLTMKILSFPPSIESVVF